MKDMRAVLQRVTSSSVVVGDKVCGAIGPGLMILLGVGKGDEEADACWLADRCARLRIFEDDNGRMNRSLQEVKGGALVVSQFTLYADTSRGLRPGFEPAEAPDRARQLCARFVRELQSLGIETQTGSFGAHMKVRLENDGPVTILLDTAQRGGRVVPNVTKDE
jgi:D-aminoacyl-tRNA deacylase